MKIKRTKKHIVLKLSRSELYSLFRVLDLGMGDFEDEIPKSWHKDIRLANALINTSTGVDLNPKFVPLEPLTYPTALGRMSHKDPSIQQLSRAEAPCSGVPEFKAETWVCPDEDGGATKID